MNDYEPTSPPATSSTSPVSSETSEPSIVGGSGGAGGAAPLQPSSPDGPALVTMAKQARRPRVRRWLSNRRSRWIVAAALMCPVIGLSVGLVTSPSASAAQLVPGSGSLGGLRSGGGGSNARSGPASGGASGTVASVSTSSFTLTTSAGQKVTVDEASSTKYLKGTSSTSASAITKGEPVLVLGTTNGTTIKATQVIVQTTGGGSRLPRRQR